MKQASFRLEAYKGQVPFILAVAGLYVSGTLSISHLLNHHLACGFGLGCARLMAIPISRAGPIPIALIGFAMYALLALSCVGFEFGGPAEK